MSRSSGPEEKGRERRMTGEGGEVYTKGERYSVGEQKGLGKQES